LPEERQRTLEAAEAANKEHRQTDLARIKELEGQAQAASTNKEQLQADAARIKELEDQVQAASAGSTLDGEPLDTSACAGADSAETQSKQKEEMS
jgi:hypothetical protein